MFSKYIFDAIINKIDQLRLLLFYSKNKMYFLLTTKDDEFFQSANVFFKYNTESSKFKSGLNIVNYKGSNSNVYIINVNTFYNTNVEHMYIRLVISISEPIILTPINLFSKLIGFPKNSKIILSDRYNLFDMETIKRFNLKITGEYIDGLCVNGKVDMLETLKNAGMLCPKVLYERIGGKLLLYYPSIYKQINVLEWWKNSGLPLEYDHVVLDSVAELGLIEVLDWWRNSGLELKYSRVGLLGALHKGHQNVINWWFNNGLKTNMFEGYQLL
jgi:hypothetical protein